MRKFNINMTVSFQGEVEAETQAEAEQIAWTAWGDKANDQISYDGVESIEVYDLGEICEGCNEGEEQCSCEDEPSDGFPMSLEYDEG